MMKPGEKEQHYYRLAQQVLAECRMLGKSRLPLVGSARLAVDNSNKDIESGYYSTNLFRDVYERGWAENT